MPMEDLVTDPSLGSGELDMAPALTMGQPVVDADGYMDRAGGIISGAPTIRMDSTFEDLFPPLELTKDQKSSIGTWFEKDLRSCLRNINNHKSKWATYRAVYMMEYVEKFYPDMGQGANYSSGLLCEKILEGMDRVRKGVFKSPPYFIPDSKSTGTDANVDFDNRATWAFQTILAKDIDVMDAIGDEGVFEFLIDGSCIVEADTVFERVPQKTLKVYTNMDDLSMDENKVINKGDLERAYAELEATGITRVLVEADVVTKNGLQIFRVDKVDHLVPCGVYSDKDMRFRARRMYLTGADLKLLASEEVGWYDKDAVEKVLGERSKKAVLEKMSRGKDGKSSQEELRSMEDNYDLMYPYRQELDLTSSDGTPYEGTFAVYRVTCKFGYATPSDPKGKIPKYCAIDYSPEGKVILRAVAYPHFKERPNWFHIKLGFAPKSYYGFGWGARLLQDDFLESNAVDLFLDSAALATFNPFMCKHPEAGGIYPFPAGYGPAKIGYANDMNDWKQVDVHPPNALLLSILLPLTQNRAANRTSITSLIQGRTESSDPRSPAQKTAMLLNEASVGIENMIDDWNKGWTSMANFIWDAVYEIAMFVKSKDGNLRDIFSGVIIDDTKEPAPDMRLCENRILFSELKRELVWISQASAVNLNKELKMKKFLEMFQFFVPLLDKMSQFAPDAFKKYFIRWMNRAAEVSELPSISYLIPREEELLMVPNDQLMQTMLSTAENLRGGRGSTGSRLELGAMQGGASGNA